MAPKRQTANVGKPSTRRTMMTQRRRSSSADTASTAPTLPTKKTPSKRPITAKARSAGKKPPSLLVPPSDPSSSVRSGRKRTTHSASREQGRSGWSHDSSSFTSPARSSLVTRISSDATGRRRITSSTADASWSNTTLVSTSDTSEPESSHYARYSGSTSESTPVSEITLKRHRVVTPPRKGRPQSSGTSSSDTSERYRKSRSKRARSSSSSYSSNSGLTSDSPDMTRRRRQTITSPKRTGRKKLASRNHSTRSSSANSDSTTEAPKAKKYRASRSVGKGRANTGGRGARRASSERSAKVKASTKGAERKQARSPSRRKSAKKAGFSNFVPCSTEYVFSSPIDLRYV